MKTAVINFKVDPKIKAAAQKRAKKLGLPLSVFLQQQLQAFASGRPVSIDFPSEPMTPHLEKLIEASLTDENRLVGSPRFSNTTDAVAWLKEEMKRGD